MANRLEGEWEIETAYNDIVELRWPTLGITSLSGIGLPPVGRAAQATPTEHGSEDLGFRLEDREVICGVAWGPKYARFGADCMSERRKSGVYKAFNQLASPLILRRTLDNHEVMELRRCYYGGGVERDTNQQYETAEFSSFLLICRDPAWYEIGTRTITVTLADMAAGVYYDIVTLTSADGLTTGGDWYAYPTIALLGPMTYFDLESTTSGQRLRFTGDIAAGETVTLITNPKVVTATSDVNGNVENYIPPGDDFGGFAIWPDPVATGGNNEWEVETGGMDANSTVTFTWEDRWQGI